MTRFSAPGQAPGDLRQLGNLRRTPGRSPATDFRNSRREWNRPISATGTFETLAESGGVCPIPRRPTATFATLIEPGVDRRTPQFPPAISGDLRNLRRTRSRPQPGSSTLGTLGTLAESCPPIPPATSTTSAEPVADRSGANRDRTGNHPAMGNHTSGDRPAKQSQQSPRSR